MIPNTRTSAAPLPLHYPSPRLHPRLRLLLLSWLCLPWILPVDIARAHPVETITSFGVTNYTGYVIDSDRLNGDASYNREDILAEAGVRYSTTNNVTATYYYQVEFRLLDGAGAVPLVLANGTTATSVVVADTIALPNVFTLSRTNSRTYLAALRPAAKLDPYRTYAVEVRLLEGTNAAGPFAPTGDTATDGPRSYRHFRSLVSGDPEFNVIPVLNTVSIARNFAVNTVPFKDAYPCVIQYTLHRYDNFGTGYVNPPGHDIPLSAVMELREAGTGIAVPLANAVTNFTAPVPVYAHGPNLLQVPAVVNGFQTVHLKPAPGAQLDPAKQYRAIVSLRHREIGAGPDITANSASNAPVRLLHFNGDLYFGGLQTRFTSIANAPAFGGDLPGGAVVSALAVDNQAGFIVNAPDHTYGDGTVLLVALRPDGSALYTGATPVPITGPNPDSGATAGIRFQRFNTRLDANGGFASFLVWFPTGFGVRGAPSSTNRVIAPYTGFLDLPLTQALMPKANPSSSLGGWGCEETKPFQFQFAGMTWDVAGGRFLFTPTGAIEYVRKRELAALKAAPVSLAYKLKPSNESHLASVEQVLGPQVIVAADPDRNSARMDIDVRLGGGLAFAHFPAGAALTWSNAATLSIRGDLFDGGASRIGDVRQVVLSYTRDCTEPDCAGGSGSDSYLFQPADDTLFLTPDGGLTAKGAIPQPKDLTWGWIPSEGRFAHRVQGFAEAGFHLPGFFLRGDQTLQTAVNRPAVLLFTGVGSNSATQVDFSRIERPYHDTYSNGTNGGFGDYAGLNFRVGADGARLAESTLAGEPTGFYPLTGRSKYYVRKGGVSGIHEAVFGSFPETNRWYGYSFQVGNFGLAFRDSQNVDSRTEGAVHVRFPSDIDQNFEKLMFSCIGGLEDATVPASEKGLYKELAYWQADLSTLSIRFDRKDGLACDPGEGKLVMGVKGHAQPFGRAAMYGELGFETNGNLITLVNSDVLKDVSSRLKLPANLVFDGPNGERWRFTPVNDAYFNNHDHRDTSGSPGWLNVAGKLDAPFFEDLRVHLHCSADKDTTNSLVHLMGGWGEAGRGYEWQSGKHFFNQNPSDKDNAGRPHGALAPSVAAYREPGPGSADRWRVRAERLWLDVVPFDYPLAWSPLARSFRSAHEVDNDLLVLNVKHQVRNLSPDTADIAFGAQFTGVPQLNIANIAYDQLGGLKSVVDDVAGDAIDRGLGGLAETLSAQSRGLFRPVFDSVLRPRIAQLIADLRGNYQQQPWTQVLQAGPILDAALTGPGANSVAGRMKSLASFAAAGTNLTETLDAKLAGAGAALASIATLVSGDGGNRPVLMNLMQGLVGRVAPEFSGAFSAGRMEQAIAQYGPALDQLNAAAAGLAADVATVRGQVAGGDFFAELNTLLNSQGGAISALLGLARADLLEVLGQFELGAADSPFAHYTDGQLADIFMQRIEDRFLGSTVASQLREAIKQRLYDLDASIRQTVDSVFQQANVAVRDILSESAQQLSGEIAPMLGSLNAIAGAGKVNGYAHINGDDLKELRIDAYAQLKVPSDMEFHGFLVIRELNSENFPTECLPAGGKATEVTLGADRIPVKFGHAADATLATQAKFTLDPDTSSLLGFAGGLDMDGRITLGPASVKKLSASIAFGAEENFFSAAARVALNSYEGFGGIFFGRTCTLAPLRWDPDIQAVLGDPPFTGGYTYVEVWIPVSEALLGIPATCMFQVSAGMGMGAGFFLEGPTFVGKALLGVSGDFLCVASISGDIRLAGRGSPSGIAMRGSGTFEVELCALVCVSASKTVTIDYRNGSWDIDF